MRLAVLLLAERETSGDGVPNIRGHHRGEELPKAFSELDILL
ncbi:hypothetical protein ACQP0C_18150 [Nocardia sp. CA-129566]